MTGYNQWPGTVDQAVGVLLGSGLKCIKYKSKTHIAQNHMVHYTLGELRRFIKESIE